MTGIGMKSTKRRDWPTARRKVRQEGDCCRLCGRFGAEAAHLWSRQAGGDESEDNILPLCREHHRQFDSHEIDVLHVLRPEEKARVVYLADQTQGLEGLEAAKRRLRPSEYANVVSFPGGSAA